MNATKTNIVCDPALHSGARVAARFLVSQAVDVSGAAAERYARPALGRVFACCDAHVGHAIDFVLAEGGQYALIRREVTA